LRRPKAPSTNARTRTVASQCWGVTPVQVAADVHSPRRRCAEHSRIKRGQLLMAADRSAGRLVLMRTRHHVAAAAVALGALAAAGCGSSSNKESTPPAAQAATTTGATEPASVVSGRNVTITMGDFFFKPHNLTLPSGKVVITAPNTGNAEHELVLLRTSTDPAKLKTEKDGEANEEAYSSPGEIADVEAGTTKHATFHLKPGVYVMICNVPGHYKAGMYGRLIVK
jgi:uncharacterized cupredoxin-like copper-binding protein